MLLKSILPKPSNENSNIKQNCLMSWFALEPPSTFKHFPWLKMRCLTDQALVSLDCDDAKGSGVYRSVVHTYHVLEVG